MADEQGVNRADELHYERMLRAINAGRLNRRQVLHRGLALGLSIPVLGRRLALGTWQGIYLWEHRAVPPGGRRDRRVVVAVMADVRGPRGD